MLLTLAVGCNSTRLPAFTLTTEPWEFQGTAGQRLLTDHFDIHTTVTDAALVDVLPGFLEACNARYARFIAPREANAPRLDTYVFNTRDQWFRFTKAFVPQRAHLYQYISNGGYTDGPTATGVFYWIGRYQTLAIAAHEGFHQYVARQLPLAVPAWLNEGLATQMEAFEIRDGAPVFEPRKNLFRRNYLRDALATSQDNATSRLIALPELLRMHAGEVITTPDKSTATYYAQVWSLTLFLLEGPNRTYRDAFARLLHEAGREEMRMAVRAYQVARPDAAGMNLGELVFRAYITEDLEGFRTEYMTFAGKLAFPGRGFAESW